MIPLIIRLLLPFFLVAPAPHEYYVSTFDIVHNPQEQSLEITTKVFLDDLEKALTREPDSPKIPADSLQSATVKARVRQYLFSHFSVVIQSKPAKLHLLGYEIEQDQAYLYSEVKDVIDFQALEVNCRFLVETYAQQMNIINLEAGGEIQTVLLDRNRTVGQFSWPTKNTKD